MTSSKDKAMEQGRQTISSLRIMLEHLEDTLNGTNEKHHHEALITLKALDAFIEEEAGLGFWCFKIRELLSQHLDVLKSLH